ncbi:MAG TPA: hypothetical protein ENI73_02080 [Spirochaetes bacterium]|nr:hypothetical protein [Spirochaetota bacterium]
MIESKQAINMIRKDFAQIAIDAVDLGNLKYSFCYPLDQAKEVIEYKGQWAYPPILVTKQPSGYWVIDGMNRIRHLASRGETCIEGFIIKSQSPLDVLTEGILYARTYKSLNLIEKASILHKLIHSFQVDESVVINHYLPLLLDNPSHKRFKLLMKLNDLSHEMKNHIIRENTPLNLSYDLSQYSLGDQAILYSWIKKLKLGVNRLKFFIESLNFLCKRDQKSVENILNNDIFVAYLSSETKHNILEKNFINDLYTLRYPAYKEHLEQVQKVIRTFKLPPRWKINVAKNMEGEGFHIDFHIRNQEEYPLALEKLETIYKNQGIEQLFTYL